MPGYDPKPTKTTFASQYTGRLTLHEALQPETVVRYAKQTASGRARSARAVLSHGNSEELLVSTTRLFRERHLFRCPKGSQHVRSDT